MGPNHGEPDHLDGGCMLGAAAGGGGGCWVDVFGELAAKVHKSAAERSSVTCGWRAS